jgi:hypothetical protein
VDVENKLASVKEEVGKGKSWSAKVPKLAKRERTYEIRISVLVRKRKSCLV